VLSARPMTVLKTLAAIQSQVFSALVAFALDQPQAQPLKVARRQLVEGQGVGCAGDGRLGLGQGFASCARRRAVSAGVKSS
jgi:hypothetical protein